LSVFVCYLTGRLADVPGEEGDVEEDDKQIIQPYQFLSAT
jgi:hypothetical protein